MSQASEDAYMDANTANQIEDDQGSSYVRALKKANPAAFAKIEELSKYSANESFGGKIQDYQAQILTPLSSDIIAKANSKEGLVPVETGYDDGLNYTTSVTGYTKDLGLVNGIPVTANYDVNGNITGYEGNQAYRTWIDGKNSIGGNWDASGMAEPKQYTSKGGGFIKGIVGDIMSDKVLGTIASAAAAYFGGPLGTGALQIAQGKDFDDVLTDMAKSYVVSSIGANVSSGLNPELKALVKSGDITASQAATLASTAGNVASNIAAGADPLKALISGGIGAGTSAITSQIPGFDDLSKEQKRSVNSIVATTLKSGDPTQSLINEAIASGVGALQDAARAPSTNIYDQSINSTNDLVSQTIGDTDEAPRSNDSDKAELETLELDQLLLPESELKIDSLLGDDSEDATPSVLPASTSLGGAPTKPDAEYDDEYDKLIGIDRDSVSDFPSMTTDPLVGMSTRGDYDEVTGKFVYDPNGSMEAPLTDKSGTNIDSMNGYSYDPKKATWTSPDGTVTDLSYLSNRQKPMDTSSLARLASSGKDMDLADLARSMLSSTSSSSLGAGVLGAGVLGYLSGNQDGLSYTGEPVQDQSVSYNPQTGVMTNGVAYGLDQLGANYTKRAAQGGIMSLAQGGQASSLGGYAAGGNPRLLRGPGDGMSDNIPATIAGKQPARLADGEFVIPADVVSHLGNGSTEAGANVLHQMMERVRKARTGNPNQGKQINPQKFVPRKGK